MCLLQMLLITLRLAMPSVLRFIVCGGIFYIAFLLLGWLVLGSYHPKVNYLFIYLSIYIYIYLFICLSIYLYIYLSIYLFQFKDPSVTSECLYSLINGDDMFDTYIQMDQLSFPAFIFSKIYLYVFISLFIYVVLSVFISLISDTYETLHVS